MYLEGSKPPCNPIKSPFGVQSDKQYMDQALHCARESGAHGEVPIGAIIVDNAGAIIAAAGNQMITRCSQTGHAELCALAQAGAKRADWRLEGCWLYVTIAPCAMCMHALYLSRLAGVVYGAESPKYGFQLDSITPYAVYKKGVVQIVSGVCGDEAAQLLHDFFAKKRKRGGGHGA